MTHCSPDTGEECFGGDHEDRNCRTIPECRSEVIVESFLNDVKKAAADRPGDAHTISQAVYVFARLGHHPSALEIAQSCQAAQWWCDLVLGMAHHRAGREDQAEVHFRSGLRGADPELACKLTALDELLEEFDKRIYDDLTCPQRTEFEEAFWWLSDPMLSIPGNDRWAEHINRRFELLLHTRLVQETRTDVEGSRGLLTTLHRDWHEARVVQRGFEDSWSIAGGMFKTWTSIEAARYRFTPVASIALGFDSLRVRVERDRRNRRLHAYRLRALLGPARAVRAFQGRELGGRGRRRPAGRSPARPVRCPVLREQPGGPRSADGSGPGRGRDTPGLHHRDPVRPPCSWASRRSTSAAPSHGSGRGWCRSEKGTITLSDPAPHRAGGY